VNEEVALIRDIIVQEYHPDKVILFGSHARGNAEPESDIDILVVSDREKGLPRYKRGIEIRKKLTKIHAPFDLLFYTHEELARFSNVRQSFCAAIQREGIVLHG